MSFILINCTLLATSYLFASATLPLQDSLFYQADLALGFDFKEAVIHINQYPLICEIFMFLYESEIYHMLLIALILSISKPEYIIEFCKLYFAALAITIFIALILPAIGPYEFLNINPDTLPNIGENKGRDHIEIVTQLRSQNGYTLYIFEAVGLVSFPSFHTILAMLVTYALRGIKPLFWFMVLINGTVIIATIPMGGHYLSDVIGGIILTISLIILFKKWGITAAYYKSQIKNPT